MMIQATLMTAEVRSTTGVERTTSRDNIMCQIMYIESHISHTHLYVTVK